MRTARDRALTRTALRRRVARPRMVQSPHGLTALGNVANVQLLPIANAQCPIGIGNIGNTFTFPHFGRTSDFRLRTLQTVRGLKSDVFCKTFKLTARTGDNRKENKQ